MYLVGRLFAFAGSLIVLLALAACGGSSGSDSPDDSAAPTATTAIESEATSEATEEASATPAPEVTLTPEPSPTPEVVIREIGPNDRITIPSIGVDALLTLGGLDDSGTLSEPNGPDDVVMYDLAIEDAGGWPGEGNTVVFGHLDSSGPCQNGTVPGPCAAVFYELKNVSLGDPIQLSLAGTTFDYVVAAHCHVRRDSFPQSIFEGGEPERITLMTGEFFGTPPNVTHYQTIIIALRDGGPEVGCPVGTEEGAVPSG